MHAGSSRAVEEARESPTGSRSERGRLQSGAFKRAWRRDLREEQRGEKSTRSEETREERPLLISKTH